MIYDVIIIGAGPCGLAMGIEAKKAGLSYLIIEKGGLTASLLRYPRHMRFFSTAENIEIGGLPFAIADFKACRDEALQYYRKAAAFYDLNQRLFTNVTEVYKTSDENFEILAATKEKFHARHVVLASGYFDFPRRLNIPGEDLPYVSHYYDEAYPYSFSKIVLVGGSNSVVEAALDLYRTNVHVTVVHRDADFRKTVKYWLVPDIKNRIKEGRIEALFHSCVDRIEDNLVYVTNTKTLEEKALPAHFVFLLTGYLPDADFLARCGIVLNPLTKIPMFNPETFETNISRLYLCGTVLAGLHTEKVFIENGREHAAAIADHIAGRPLRKVKELIRRI